MNKHFLKSIRDNIPDYLKYPTASLFRNELILNKEFCKFYNLLEKRETLSKEAIKEYQFVQLKNLLIHAQKNVPYYSKLFDQVSFNSSKFTDFEQLSSIPFLTRDIVKSNYNKLISKKNVKNGYYEGLTGGSTGVALKFLLDYDSVGRENAFIYYYRKKLGYKLEDKTVTFRQVEYGDKLWKYSPMHNEIIFFPMKVSKVTINEYAKKINEYQPQYLNGYLSAIWYFAKLLDEFKIDLRFKVKGIFLTSENIDSAQRKFIEEFFGAKSITFYGHSERCVIAEEIYPLKYLFDPYYGYTEQVINEESTYSIVGTGFLNYTMPFIRYKTDDICRPDNQYFNIEGKRDSTSGLYGNNDEFLPSSVLDLDQPVFKNIITYQFFQEKKGKADLLVIAGNLYKPSEMEGMKAEMNRQTSGIIEINIKLVDRLLLSQRGKYQMYITSIR